MVFFCERGAYQLPGRAVHGQSHGRLRSGAPTSGRELPGGASQLPDTVDLNTGCRASNDPCWEGCVVGALSIGQAGPHQ